MGFSRYAWELYAASRDGKAAISRNLDEHRTSGNLFVSGESWADYQFPIVEGEAGEEFEIGDLRHFLVNVLSVAEVASLNDACSLFQQLIDHGASDTFDRDGKEATAIFDGFETDPGSSQGMCSYIGPISVALHETHPDYFFPYLFSAQYQRFSDVCNHYSIDLPEVPGKLQFRQRVCHYGEINDALQRFRQQARLSPAELNAFFYDFVDRDYPIISDAERGSELPTPSRVWFIIGGKGFEDFAKLDSATPDESITWHGALEARRGDIVVMWCVSPRSAVHSIWRALSNGFVDPFFGYYTALPVGHVIRVPPITFREIQSHPAFADLPAVRAHFQGRSGMPLKVDEYEALVQIISGKGDKEIALPESPPTRPLPNVELSVERDVELQLLEPLLQSLGYTDEDWVYQMRIRMGRGERNVPDYVIGAYGASGEEEAILLIEAKLDIWTEKERKETYKQAKSYANRLQSQFFCLAARQGFWLFTRKKDGFDCDQYQFFVWSQLADPDQLAEVDRVIGKRAVDRLLIKYRK